MTAFQALFIAILQGVTELFPVSSLGHAVVLPSLLGWDIDQHAEGFLPFLVVLHLGTAAALLAYFWRDWVQFLLAILGRPTERPRAEELRILGLMIVATIPAGILGLALEHKLRLLFGSAPIAAVFLIVNGFVLFVGERLRRRSQQQASSNGGMPQSGAQDGLSRLSWGGAFIIGIWQSLALIPGISRSGTTMVGGLLLGLNHRDTARFSFLIATPVIAAAGLKEVPKLLHYEAETGGGFAGLALVAGIVAGIVAFASTAFLMRYFRQHDFEALDPFAYYCWVAGAGALAVLYLR